MSATTRPVPVFDHLDQLSDERGVFEHAEFAVPRRQHGYCVDDVARGLVIACRENRPPLSVRRLERRYLTFVLDALAPDGSCHNRMATDGEWRDPAAVGDWWGRAVWGLGVAAVHGRTDEMRERAMTGFRVAVQQRSPHPRTMAFAALGAAEVAGAHRWERAATDLLVDAVVCIGPNGTDVGWPWPEPRLGYANGVLAEALIVAGAGLNDRTALEHGLHLLEFLLRIETRDGHLSVSPVGGRGRGEIGPLYDQQPIEVASLADACASAYRATLDPRWLLGVRLAWNWFLGDNDASVQMFDAETGGGFDGLHADGCNLNQGAESTLAMLSTAQHARSISELR